MAAALGAVIGIGGAISGAYAIVSLVRLGSCLGVCAAHTAVVPYLIGGILAVTASAFLWRWSMAVSPVAGLVAAGVLLRRQGVDIVGDNLGFTAFIAACVLAGPVILAIIGTFTAGRRRRAAQIVRDGLRAVAEVQEVRGTGVEINHQPQVAVTYTISPLDGSQPFPYSQRRTIGVGETPPRPGFRWPAWYLPGRTDAVAIGAPNSNPADPQTRALLAEFGIHPAQAYGYDPTAATGLANH